MDSYSNRIGRKLEIERIRKMNNIIKLTNEMNRLNAEAGYKAYCLHMPFKGKPSLQKIDGKIKADMELRDDPANGSFTRDDLANYNPAKHGDIH